ncbi:hypothetical protein NYE48_27625 [Paenibacillus sp. FSL M7-1455]|uniref:hypothetical protein n=1 Tax=Paenibacillus sp. FSL M7-1455 TaxID=2975316 RepID=UPI0030FC297B
MGQESGRSTRKRGRNDFAASGLSVWRNANTGKCVFLLDQDVDAVVPAGCRRLKLLKAFRPKPRFAVCFFLLLYEAKIFNRMDAGAVCEMRPFSGLKGSGVSRIARLMIRIEKDVLRGWYWSSAKAGGGSFAAKNAFADDGPRFLKFLHAYYQEMTA